MTPHVRVPVIVRFQIVGLGIIGIWSAMLFCMSLLIATEGLEGFVTCTIPFIVANAVIVVLSTAGCAVKRARTALFWIAVLLDGLLIHAAEYGRWPPGDDGPGMAWALIAAGGSGVARRLAIVLALTTIVIAVITLPKRKAVESLEVGR